MDNQIDENFEKLNTTNFNPVEYGLAPSFRFSYFGNVNLHGVNLQDTSLSDEDFSCSVWPLRHSNNCLLLAQSSSSITSVIDDPVMIGRIACINILSNLYGNGIIDCDNIQLILKLCKTFNEIEKDVISQLIYDGFKETAKNASITVKEASITFDSNWCIIGGVGNRRCNKNELISHNGAVKGDVIILTKPLGTQVAISAYQWLDKPEQRNRIERVVSDKQIREAHTRAINSMARSNRDAAKLMHDYNAHCSTNISYLGLLGHANELAKRQKNEVSFAIRKLPIIENMAAISKACGNEFKLADGHCPEISGGLLICLPKKKADHYCEDILKNKRQQAWVIGRVKNGNRTAFLTEKRCIIEVNEKSSDVKEENKE